MISVTLKLKPEILIEKLFLLNLKMYVRQIVNLRFLLSFDRHVRKKR